MKKNIKVIFSFLLGALAMLSCADKLLNGAESNPIAGQMKMLSNTGKGKYGNVSPQIATEVAKNFIVGISDEYSEYTVDKVEPILDSTMTACMYIVNFYPKGNVIVSGDIRSEPIFSYSLTSNISTNDEAPYEFVHLLDETVKLNKIIVSYDTNPTLNEHIINNVHSWIAMVDETSLGLVLEIVNRNNWEGYDDICKGKPIQKRLTDSTLFKVGPLLSTTWGQDTPYNYKIKQHRPVGCFGVAMAQIMKFHEYPTSSYNWTIMPNACGNSYDNMSSGELEVASLMLQAYNDTKIGIVSDADGTGSTPGKVESALKKYGYNENLKVEKGLDLPKFQNEIINNRRPIFMAGLPPKSNGKKKSILWKGDINNGHAFVVNGYQRKITGRYIDCIGKERSTPSKDFLYINYGWKGYYDNWIYINRYLDRGKYKYEFADIPNEINYFDRQRHIINIYPQ